jgi:hypothetical protein
MYIGVLYWSEATLFKVSVIWDVLKEPTLNRVSTMFTSYLYACSYEAVDSCRLSSAQKVIDSSYYLSLKHRKAHNGVAQDAVGTNQVQKSESPERMVCESPIQIVR